MSNAVLALSLLGVVVFGGTTPGGDEVRRALDIPAAAQATVIHWRVTLVPGRYELSYEYDATAAHRQGSWSETKGTLSDPNATVYRLRGALDLVRIDANIVHLLNDDRSLMRGDSGWSYTLNRLEHFESRLAAGSVPDLSYRLTPLATGPGVFGVFEGRTPCQGIARELQIAVHAGCAKAKWRLTLYRDPSSLEPTRYRIEGNLFRRRAARGTWTAEATVYRLSRPGNLDLLLLKGDDDVLFILNRDGVPLVGTDEFSYTLNRRR